jgi:hypothetical protein
MIGSNGLSRAGMGSWDFLVGLDLQLLSVLGFSLTFKIIKGCQSTQCINIDIFCPVFIVAFQTYAGRGYNSASRGAQRGT